jgi:hypothetical protein
MVFNTVAARVRWAFSALTVLFMGDPIPPEMEFILPPSNLALPVGSWATLALSPGSNRNVAKDTLVKCAIHYKSREKKRHEKLLIVVQTPHAGTVAYMIVDRGPDQDEIEARRKERPSMSPSPAGSLADVSLTSEKISADDRVYVPRTQRFQSMERYKKYLSDSEHYDALCTVTLNTPMSLAQLAVLLKAVHQHRVDYHLLKYQCYWHAYTVWEVLRAEFGGVVTQNELQARRGKYMGVNIRRKDSVEAITDAYNDAWKVFCEEETGTHRQAEDVIRQVSLAAYGCAQHLLTISTRPRNGGGRRGGRRAGRKSERGMRQSAKNSRPIGEKVHYKVSVSFLIWRC